MRLYIRFGDLIPSNKVNPVIKVCFDEVDLAFLVPCCEMDPVILVSYNKVNPWYLVIK